MAAPRIRMDVGMNLHEGDTMPDQNVIVGFSPPTSTGTWTVDNRTVTMTSAGLVIFHRKSDNLPWTFVSINGLPSTWTQRILGNGSILQVSDTLEPPVQSFKYTITVSYLNVQYTSPAAIGSGSVAADVEPPIVRNDGTTLGEAPSR